MRDIVGRIRVTQRRRHQRDASFGAPRAAHVADGLFVYLDVVAGPRYLAGQGFKEYRCDPSTGLTFDPSVVSHTCLYLPACIFSVSCTSPVPAASYLPSTQYLALNCPLNSWTLQLDLYPRQSVEAVRRKRFVILSLSVSSALYRGVSSVDPLQY